MQPAAERAKTTEATPRSSPCNCSLIFSARPVLLSDRAGDSKPANSLRREVSYLMRRFAALHPLPEISRYSGLPPNESADFCLDVGQASPCRSTSLATSTFRLLNMVAG